MHSLFVALVLGVTHNLNAETDRIANLHRSLRQSTISQPALLESLTFPESEEIAKEMVRVFYNSESSKYARQAVASTLLGVGRVDDAMFQYLAGFALAAVKHEAPIFIKYDLTGHSIRKEYSREFEDWCKQKGCSVQDEIKLQMFTLPEDVRLFAQTLDARTAPVLTVGIGSNNPWIVLICARSLARLGKGDVIPLLVSSIEPMPAEAKDLVAGSLPFFGTDAANRAFQRLVPDARRRAHWENDAIRTRTEDEGPGHAPPGDAQLAGQTSNPVK